VAAVTIKKRDQNRFSKIYPYARFQKREVLEVSEDFRVETGTISFIAESGPKSYTFLMSYSSAPSISAISVETTDNANVNIYVTSISTTSVSFESSAPFTGDVTFSIIQVA
jgi:hypothetical protein